MSESIDLSFFDNAPAAIMFVKVEKNKEDIITGFSYEYSNQKLKKLGILIETKEFEKSFINFLNSENREEFKICIKVAIEGEQRTLTDHYFSVYCWQPKSEYFGCIFKDITKEKKLDQSKIIEIENSNVILQNTAELVIDFDLRQIDTDYFRTFGNIPAIDCTDLKSNLKPFTLAEESIERFIQMLETLKNSDIPVKGKLKIQTAKGNKYEWYEIRLCREGQRIIGCGRNINDGMLKLEKLQLQAERDCLTGILNRQTAENLIERECQKELGSMFVMDIDDFKSINDTHGHPIGDQVIKNLACIIKDSFRQTDITYRIGGDEFGVFTPGLYEYEEIIEKCNKLFEEIEGVGRKIPFSASIGVSVNSDPNNPATYKRYYKQADSALYKAKHGGKRKWAVLDI